MPEILPNSITFVKQIPGINIAKMVKRKYFIPSNTITSVNEVIATNAINVGIRVQADSMILILSNSNLLLQVIFLCTRPVCLNLAHQRASLFLMMPNTSEESL